MKKAAAPSFHLSELDESEEELLEELLCKHPKRTLIVDMAARKDMQRSGKEDSTRQGWRKTEGERERETERGRGKERERDRERERCKWWAAGCFRVVSDLFLSLGYLSFGEKTGKNEKRKKRREKETETKKKSWDGEQEDVSNWFQTSFGACYGAT